MTKLELLYAQKSEKFGELCALAARELGYGELSTLSVEHRIRVEDQAKQYVEQWEETVEMTTSPTIRPMTPLRRLLAEYHDTCEKSSMSKKSRSVSGLTRNDRKDSGGGRRPSSSGQNSKPQGRQLRSAPFLFCQKSLDGQERPLCRQSTFQTKAKTKTTV